MSIYIWYYMPGSLYSEVCIHAKLLQSCLTLWDPMDCCLPGFSVHGILQARILKWVAMPSSRGSFLPRDWTLISCSTWIAGRFFTTEPPGKPLHVAVQSFSHVWFFVNPWAAACQASLSSVSLSFLMSTELVMPCCYSHAFRETDSLRRTMQIVECSLLSRRAQGRVSS